MRLRTRGQRRAEHAGPTTAGTLGNDAHDEPDESPPVTTAIEKGRASCHVASRNFLLQQSAGLVWLGDCESVHDQGVGDDVAQPVGAHDHGGEAESV